MQICGGFRIGDNSLVGRDLPVPGVLASRWDLDSNIVFLNHGSFGAAPRAVREEQNRIRESLESEPVRFFERRYQVLLDRARERLAEFVGASPANLVFVANATTGVNTVLRSLDLRSGDELLTTNHEYNACRNALAEAARAAGASVVVAEVPYPLSSDDEVLDAVLDLVTPRTRLLLVDQVTSQTGLVLPVASLVREAQLSGVDVLVDGAHAPGMVELNLEKLGAAYYTGNCHKWLCAPKGAGFLYVREDLRSSVRPLVISHGANAAAERRSRFHLEHDWTGTHDPSAWLSVPAAIAEVESMAAGGWSEVRQRNHEMALAARDLLCEALGADKACPDGMVGSMATVALPDSDGGEKRDAFSRDALQDALYREWAIEVPVIPWPSPPGRLVRISAQLYNSRGQYEYLAEALRAETISK
jgi:isopenicillin-N epimerase